MAKPPRPDRNRPDAGACCIFFAMRTNGRRFLKRGCSRPVVCRSTGNGAFAFTPITRNGRRGLPIQIFAQQVIIRLRCPALGRCRAMACRNTAICSIHGKGRRSLFRPMRRWKRIRWGATSKAFSSLSPGRRNAFFSDLREWNPPFIFLSMGTGSAMRRILLAPQNLS